jgi:adenine-specific DNA-methyltransferase
VARQKKPAHSVSVEAVTHRDTRPNIPTREQGGLVTDADAAPQPLLYPRDTSLDPQLVWKGKDEQDRAGLEVPALPIFIQEKILPQAIIESLRASTEPAQMELFAGMEGPSDPGKRTEFYRHGQNWANRLILGDSLLTMVSLAEKEGLKGRVQMVYIDPPYGIKFGAGQYTEPYRQRCKGSGADPPTRTDQGIP